MKRWIILMIGFLCCIGVMQVSASTSWKFEWENTVVSIPVGGALNSYKDSPKAKLYRDNVLLGDAEITYAQEGDWLYYLKDVNTSVVGEYEVWYKAYENKYRPGTCPGYKCKVKFVVEDKTAPSIQVLNTRLKLLTGETYDLNQNIIVSDNYDSEVSVRFSTEWNTNTVGEYNVEAYAIDSSGNTASSSFLIEVYGKEPNLICKNGGNHIVVGINDTIDFSLYFEAVDIVDGDISSQIQYTTIDTSKTGIVQAQASITNSNHLTSTYDFEVEVLDDQAPVIVLSKEEIILDYEEDFTTYNFKQYANVEDNNEVVLENLTIKHELINVVGTYQVQYIYKDNVNKFTVYNTLTVILHSFVKPKIRIQPIEIPLGGSVDLLDYIEIIDPSDPNILNSLELYADEVDYNSVGEYTIEVYVINSSGLSSTLTAKVKIYEESETDELEIEGSTTQNLTMFEKLASGSIKEYLFLGIIGILVGINVFQFIHTKRKKSI